MGMGSPRARVGLLLATIFCAFDSAAALPPDNGDRFVVADFDDPAKAGTVTAEGSKVVLTPEIAESKNLVGAWSFEAGTGAALVLRYLPPDLSSFGAFRFRIRQDAAGPTPSVGVMVVRVLSSKTDEIRARIPAPGTTWRLVSLDLSRLTPRGNFDPSKPTEVRFEFTRPHPDATLWVDDVCLDRDFAEPLDRRARALEPVWTVDDFSSSGAEDRVETWGGSVEDATGKTEGGYLRWIKRDEVGSAKLTLIDLPLDLSDYRKIRFRVRAEKGGPLPVEVRFRSVPAGSVVHEVKGVGPKWDSVEIAIPKMKAEGAFDPATCECLEFSVARVEGAEIHLDDVVLEKGPDRLSAGDRATLERLFGKAKAPKCFKRQTLRFDLWTDAQGAAERLPDGLEKACAFIRDTLGLPEMESALPVYAFQAIPAVQEFLARETALSKARLQRARAYGTPRFLTLLYTSPEDRMVVRELTHSLFQRARGAGGGSWLHEGMGNFMESVWAKQDPAADFAPNLRGGKFLPLREVLAIPDLMEHDDPKGGAGDRWAVIGEAGAFYAFLVRGPLGEKWAKAEPVLARKKVDPGNPAKHLEEAMGMTLAEIEKAWVEWGSRAGKGK